MKQGRWYFQMILPNVAHSVNKSLYFSSCLIKLPTKAIASNSLSALYSFTEI